MTRIREAAGAAIKQWRTTTPTAVHLASEDEPLIALIASALSSAVQSEREECAKVADERVELHREALEKWRQSGAERGEAICGAVLGEAERIAERIRARKDGA